MKEIKDRILRTEKMEWRSLLPFQPENLKSMTEESFTKLKNNITKRHFLTTFVIWQDQKGNNWILDGHHRKYALEALEKEGYEIPEKLSCDVVACDNKQEACEIILSYASSHARVDELGLSEFIHTNNLDFEDLIDTLDIYGIDLADLMNENLEELEPQCDEDDVPELPSEPITKIGDVWILGEHRLMCGDSTSIDAVEKLMNGHKADMVFTDPPYNADYSSRVDVDKRKPWGGILNDNMSDSDFDSFLNEVFMTLYASMKQDAAIYCCIDWKHYPQLAKHFVNVFTHKSTIIWDKKHFALGTYYRTQYEMILFGTVGDKLATWNAASDERDVWSMSRESTASYVHPTQKPVELIERAINNTSNAAHVILDLFGGSGSTMIACEKTRRKSCTMELSPNYCDVILNRWIKYTGKYPILEETGEVFSESRNQSPAVASH